MAEEHSGDVLGALGRVFREGTVAGLTDAQLLDRFVACRDALAFEALVARHGPMVLGICRRRLRDEHSAEDAFQATFLVLVRKARPGLSHACDSLGPWLCAVAWRVAERSRADIARRVAREGGGEALGQTIARTDSGQDDRDVRALIDEEVGRLPEKYRLPVVLCHLEGLTHAEAARRTCCPPARISVAPDRLDEFLWRAVSLHWLPRSVMDLRVYTPDSSRLDAVKQGAGLALHLARYDRELARSILGPALNELLAVPADVDGYLIEWRLILMALAQVDPARSAAVIAALPDLKEGPEHDSVRDQAPRELAKAPLRSLEQVLVDARIRMVDLEILLRESP